MSSEPSADRSVPAGRRSTRRVDLPLRTDRRTSGSAGAVLRAVLDHGPVARSSIARLTGLSAASITGLSGGLIERGMLREAPEAAGPPGVGRPHVPVDIDTGTTVVVGAHIAVHRLTVSLHDLRGRLVTQRQVEHRDRSAETVLARLVDLVRDVVAQEAGERDVLGLGVASGGWVDAAAGRVVEHRLLGWRDVRLREVLARGTGLPVAVDGHSRALVHAEQLFGEHAERARSSIVHLFVGNVVDIAFASGGTLHQGARSAAGAIAHVAVDGSTEACVCGRIGCFQAEVSEQTLVRRAQVAGLIEEPDFRRLVALAGAGEPAAVELFERRVRTVGRMAATLVDLLNPEVLIVVEAGLNRIPACLDLLRTEVATRSLVCEDPVRSVVSTSFPGRVLSTAGGAVALERVYAAPLAQPRGSVPPAGREG
ncbi:ROK family protein [Nocardioides sp. NPDC057577]|uniref:ROK family protein n=1 Tax=Nocardioides sp. NPDC057577 TaxID=3346171 RepID=UPI00366BC8A1